MTSPVLLRRRVPELMAEVWRRDVVVDDVAVVYVREVCVAGAV